MFDLQGDDGFGIIFFVKNMTETKKEPISSLSGKRIVISLLIIALLPILHILFVWLTKDNTISFTFAFNFCSWLLLIYDWNLFGIHWNRFKARKNDCILYTIVGFLLIGLWICLNQAFLKGSLVLPNPDIVREYQFALPAIFAAFSYSQTFLICIGFKCLTDHMDIRSREVLLILLSGVLFGFFYTLAITPSFQIITLVETYLFHTILICILSYLYNQSSSLLPGMISLGTILFLIELVQFLSQPVYTLFLM